MIRRFDETRTTFLNLNELQCWVNRVNIIIDNGLTSYFAMWSSNDVSIAPFFASAPASKIYNKNIESTFGVQSGSNANALIIKNIPLTSINEIQAIVLYNRKIEVTSRVLGLLIELYNSTNDPDLTEVFANTNVITTNVARYRYNFPSISTYTGSFATTDSTTLIISDTVALTEEANVISFPIEITGDLVANGVNINTTLADILSRLELLENP